MMIWDINSIAKIMIKLLMPQCICSTRRHHPPEAGGASECGSVIYYLLLDKHLDRQRNHPLRPPRLAFPSSLALCNITLRGVEPNRTELNSTHAIRNKPQSAQRDMHFVVDLRGVQQHQHQLRVQEDWLGFRVQSRTKSIRDVVA